MRLLRCSLFCLLVCWSCAYTYMHPHTRTCHTHGRQLYAPLRGLSPISRCKKLAKSETHTYIYTMPAHTCMHSYTRVLRMGGGGVRPAHLLESALLFGILLQGSVRDSITRAVFFLSF